MKTELAIIGAGPAGMAAAKVAAAHDVSVTIIDEQRSAGGQFLRQPPAEFRVSNWLSGATYRSGKRLISDVKNLPNIHWQMQSSVSGILRQAHAMSGFELVLDSFAASSNTKASEQTATSLLADTVLLAPGCYDMPVLFPGWNLPGVMAAGGIQAFVKSQQFVPGERFLFAGTHPLQLVVADQIVKAGGKVAGVLFAQSRKRALALLREPSVLLANTDKFRQTANVLKRLRNAGVPVKFNQTLIAANGESSLQGVTTALVGSDGNLRRDQTEEFACDRLGVCFGFLTSSELARQAGANCRWDAARGGFLVSANAAMQSSVDDLYVAGEITGVAGSEVAALEGQIAAFHLMARLGRISSAQANQASNPIRQQHKKAQRFARLLSQLSWPGHSLLDQLMQPSVTLCKCEEITVGQVQSLLGSNPHITTANAAKLLSRVGMGLCQGRYCHYGLTRVMAQHCKISESAVGGFTARFPSKPLAIDQLVEECSGDD